jgi:ABC-type multidrug transport system fused ATPase/permease subunit
MYAVKSQSNLTRILFLAKPFWGKLIGVSFIILLMSGISQIYPLITRSLTDLITEGKTNFLFFKNTTFVSLIILTLILRVLGSILNRLSWYSSNLLKTKLLHHLREIAYKHLLKLSIGFYNQNQSGKTMSKLTRGTGNITGIITNVGMHFLPNMITAIISIIIVSSINLPLGIASVSMFIPFFIIRRLTFKKLEKVEKKSQKTWDREYSHFWEVLTNIRLVKAFSAEKIELKKFYRTVKKLIGLRTNMEKIHNKNQLADITMEVWMTGIIAYSFYLGLIGHFTIGTVILMVQYTRMIRQPLWNLSWVFWEMKFAQIGVKDYLKILDQKIDIKEIGSPIAPTKIKGDVSFDNIWFKYPDKTGQKVFENISFQVQSGQILALVGKSGVGKSTIAHLMVRFFDPDQGHIKIDDIDLRDLPLKFLRQNIGLVSQDSHLFDTTIAENLRYGLPSATIKQMRQACKAANALEFINKLPKKLNTVIGERGVRLSGGQKQRLSIARTILKNPKILILDEATSSLDSHSEKLVQDALWKLIKGRTAIIIAHRLSTIQRADKLLVLDHKKIAEIGSHQELLDKKGLYYQLHQLQTTEPDKLKNWDITS